MNGKRGETLAGTQAIETAVYSILKNDSVLDGLASIYKGAKRPTGAENPVVTIGSGDIRPGGGEGMHICEITVTVYTDILSNRMADNETHGSILSQVGELLADTVITLENAQCLPLRKTGNTGIEWKSVHDAETYQRITFELTFIDFSQA